MKPPIHKTLFMTRNIIQLIFIICCLAAFVGTARAVVFEHPVTRVAEASNLVFEGRPYYATRRFDVLKAIGATSTDTGINGYLYHHSGVTVSNLFYGRDTTSTFAYTNTAGWWLTYDGTASTSSLRISNNANALFWRGSPGSMLPVNQSLTTPWEYKLDFQLLYFPFGTIVGAAAAGPSISVQSYIYGASTEYPKVVVFDGDSRLAGWPEQQTYGATYVPKVAAGHPFFRNAYVTNFAAVGNSSLDVSNRYAANVYPLRPRAGQVGYYIVWTGANGDGPTTITSTLQPLFKQAKIDGWTVVVVTSPPTPAYETVGGYIFGEHMALVNQAIRDMNGDFGTPTGNAGNWDILVDLETALPNLLDRDISADGLHPYRQGATLRIGEYIALRCQQGTMTDGGVLNIMPPYTVGVYYKYGVTNVIFRGATNWQNFRFTGIPVVAGDGFMVTTNLGKIPPVPPEPGAVFLLNSNGFMYQILSTNGGGGILQTWTGTNKWGW